MKIKVLCDFAQRAQSPKIMIFALTSNVSDFGYSHTCF